MPVTGFLIRHVQWPLMERWKKNRTRQYIRELRQGQSLPTEALQASQREKLRTLLEHAVHNVPAYAPYAQEWQESHDNPEAFLLRLPILSKSRFRQNAEQYIAQNGDRSTFIPNRTGGSTGEPVSFYLERPAVEQYEAARWLGLSWHGIQIGDPCVMIWGSPLELSQHQQKRYRWKERWLKNRLIIPAYDLDERRLDTYLRLIRRFSPVYLYGYTSALYTLASMMLEKGLTLDVPLKAVVSTAESLHEHQRAVIARAFAAPVINEYGARDGGIIAYQCPSGRMHAFSENCYLEVVDPISGIPLRAGETGLLLVTDLHNTVMPRLRYQLGDLIALSAQTCDCGIGYPLIEHIDGREDDMFVSEHGTFVHGHYFNHIIRNMSSFRTFQIVQHERQRVSLKLVKEPKVYLPAEEAQLLEGIRAALGNVDVQVSYVEQIAPSASGKFRYAIREFPLTTDLLRE
ncbi:phenylacetate--CoA ligase family protein [Brevibacillus sp. TJ4]|uniref:phenylacetate--CoA ligase family protein n=1 Tax=Brevibacillus sp. TJ4 TaxID=3234853 RepID=UPI0037D5F9BF